MNSEELEKSLVTEFENYLKTFLAEMKQETAEFQGRIEAEFEKQKAQMDEAFKGFAARFDSDPSSFDAAFTGSVAEHLRLARDEGARVAANAMVEAENLGQSPLAAVPLMAAKYDTIRDAVEDISSKDSQSAILKALVHHAAGFAPRGSFFIIKADHFAGWKVFGADDAAETAVRDIHFAVSTNTILGASVAGKAPVEGSVGQYAEDARFLDPLRFGEPGRMYAIPLVARGRAVAVLYADHGDDANSNVNREALETLVRVAGLTVELLASMQTAKSENRTVAPADFEDVSAQSVDTIPFGQTVGYESPAAPSVPEPDIAEVSIPFAKPEPQREETPFAFSDSASFDSGLAPEVSSNPFEAEPPAYGSFETDQEVATDNVEESVESDPFAAEQYQSEAFAEQTDPASGVWADNNQHEDVSEHTLPESSPFAEPLGHFSPVAPAAETEQATSGEIVFESSPSYGESPQASHFEQPQASPFEQPKEQFEPAGVVSGAGFSHQPAEPAVIDAPVVKAPQPRLSERNVDLPIEVPEDERRIHNDARRFARLLVSEIKLYNEKKVIEGREANDLYERLREAIDRSREMYDKRVQPPVAAKFDYFHYELVNSLAEGRADRLGSGYPGSTV